MVSAFGSVSRSAVSRGGRCRRHCGRRAGSVGVTRGTRTTREPGADHPADHPQWQSHGRRDQHPAQRERGGRRDRGSERGIERGSRGKMGILGFGSAVVTLGSGLTGGLASPGRGTGTSTSRGRGTGGGPDPGPFTAAVLRGSTRGVGRGRGGSGSAEGVRPGGAKRVASRGGVASTSGHRRARVRPVGPRFRRLGPGSPPPAGSRPVQPDRGRPGARRATRRPGGACPHLRRRGVRPSPPGRMEGSAECFVVLAAEAVSHRGP